MWGSMILEGSGVGAATLWREFSLFQEPIVMGYGVSIFILWWTPLYSWLLLVSAWARRTPILWAVLPLMAIAAVERIVFGSMHFIKMLEYRLTGAMKEGFAFAPKKGAQHPVLDQLSQLDPLKYFTRPGLWFGLLFAAAFLAGAVRLRRYREPI